MVTDIEWIKQTVKFVGFLMPGELRTFTPTQAEEARAWVSAESA